FEWPMQQAQLDTLCAFDHRVAAENRALVCQDIASDARNRLEVRGVDGVKCFAELFRSNPDLARRELPAIDPAGIIQYRIEPAFGNVRANSLDDLLRRQRLAERRNRARSSFRADNVSKRAELSS